MAREAWYLQYWWEIDDGASDNSDSLTRGENVEVQKKILWQQELRDGSKAEASF